VTLITNQPYQVPTNQPTNFESSPHIQFSIRSKLTAVQPTTTCAKLNKTIFFAMIIVNFIRRCTF